ncbi:MAG: TetR/AcrR family transcriptional regulator [Pseudomonadota bacterium]
MNSKHPTDDLIVKVPGSSQPKQARSVRSHEAIIGALRSLLEEHYFEDLTVQQIADKAGVSVGVCYQRFGSKQGLLAYVYREFEKDLEPLVKEHASASRWQGLSGAEMAAAAAEDLYRFYRKRRGLLRTFYLWLRLHPESASPESGKRRRAQMRGVGAAMVAAGGFSQKPATVAQALAQLSLVLVDQVLFEALPPTWLSSREAAGARRLAVSQFAAVIEGRA